MESSGALNVNLREQLEEEARRAQAASAKATELETKLVAIQRLQAQVETELKSATERTLTREEELKKARENEGKLAADIRARVEEASTSQTARDATITQLTTALAASEAKLLSALAANEGARREIAALQATIDENARSLNYELEGLNIAPDPVLGELQKAFPRSARTA